MTPTEEDMKVDLAAALAKLGEAVRPWSIHADECVRLAVKALPAAIRRAAHAEAKLPQERRKGRIDACRVIDEMAARFPCSALVLRECVRAIERMGEGS